jgi:hypothetical protein
VQAAAAIDSSSQGIDRAPLEPTEDFDDQFGEPQSPAGYSLSTETAPIDMAAEPGSSLAAGEFDDFVARATDDEAGDEDAWFLTGRQ